jgi:beta-glucosidase
VIASKTFDKLNLEKGNMADDKVPSEDFSARFTCFFSPEVSGSYWLGLAGDDGYKLFVDGKMVIEQWQNQGETIRKFEGEFKKGQEYKIEVEYYQAGGDAIIRLGSQKREGKELGPEEYLSEAVKAAKNSDIAIVVWLQ